MRYRGFRGLACRACTVLWLVLLLSACGGGGSGSVGSYLITGSVTGLQSGASLILRANGQSPLTVTANGGFRFAASFASGANYQVTVSAQPAGETCLVTNGAGTVVTTNVTDIQVACTANPVQTYTIGGTVSGLSGSVSLQDNGGAPLAVAANGIFTFPAGLVEQAAYDVTVANQPAGQTCTVANGAGTVQGANVAGVTVRCANDPNAAFSVGGSISGLSGSITLQDVVSTQSAVFDTDGSFALPRNIASGDAYDVQIALQPTGQICSVVNGSGTVGTGNVTGVTVTCNADFSVGGTLSGLAAGAAVGLLDNGSDTLTRSVNGSFTFPTQFATGVVYGVTVGSQPAYQTCTVSGGSGTIAADVTNVAVGCAGSESVVHSFSGAPADGANPQADLVVDASGNLYGTTYVGGSAGAGTVFKLAPNGVGEYAEAVLYSFAGSPADGANPTAGLVMDASGNFYGTTYSGGANGAGTVFKLAPNGSGGYVETVLYAFTGGVDGGQPNGSLVMDSSGNLYGTTSGGGTSGYGTVFELVPNNHTEIVLHAFGGSPSDGAHPLAGLVIDSRGDLYGTTNSGGAVGSGFGTVFRIVAGGTESVLHSFGTGTDGISPIGGLTLDATTGNFYGTANGGGANGAGAVFEIAAGGTESILWSFGGAGSGDGQNPYAGLVMDSSGNFYGTTSNGGSSAQCAHGCGTVFKLTPGGAESVLWSFGTGMDGQAPQAGLLMDPATGNLYGTTNGGGAVGVGLGTVFEIRH